MELELKPLLRVTVAYSYLTPYHCRSQPEPEATATVDCNGIASAYYPDRRMPLAVPARPYLKVVGQCPSQCRRVGPVPLRLQLDWELEELQFHCTGNF